MLHRSFSRSLGSALVVLLVGCGPSILTVDPGASGGGGDEGTSTTTTSMTSSTTTTTTALIDPGVRLSHGAKIWCIKEAAGTVVCDQSYMGNPQLVALPGIDDAVAVVRSIEQGCVLHASGEVSCWGWSHKGQLGLAVPIDESSDVPLLLPGVNLVKIASGHHSVCGIEPSGQAVCWGGAYTGPLGDPSVSQSQAPVNVLGVPDAIDIDNSYEEACAVRASGKVLCWRVQEAPHEVAGIANASHVAVGFGRVCVVVDGGKVVCWDELVEDPAPVVEIDDAVQVAVGSYHACARRASGKVACWSNAGSTAADFWPSPVDDAVDIAVPDSGESVCAVRSTGDVVCWSKGTEPKPFPG